MKWDAFVYARGVQRTDGFKMRAQPDGFPIEAIQDCQHFFNCREGKDAAWREIIKNDPMAYEKSFMFIIRPQYKSCLLVRAAKVTSGANNEVLLDFQDRQIWSLEGIWCPYEKADIMFASLPSIIMQLSDNRLPLCGRLAPTGEASVEIEDKYYYNPYEDYDGYDQDAPPVPKDIAAFSTIEEKTALRMLANKIKFAGKPFAFFFGPLAEVMMKECAKRYDVNEFFSTVNPSSLGTLGADTFLNIENAELAAESDGLAERKKYVLQCCLGQNENKESVFRWSIAEDNGGNTDEEVLSGDSMTYNEEKGLRFIKLKAEAEAVRQFACNMQWEVQQASDSSYSMYTFFKEV
ncbi:MAG: hypothetical protein IJ666_03395 [Ruminococcus sp.]|nr:hypothetical protein [Ruminococcus sp.]